MKKFALVVVAVAALIIVPAISTVADGAVILTLTTPGVGNVTIPAGYEWTDVTVQCWGGGGGGGGFGNYTGGGGGGGGAYSSKTYTTLVAGEYGYYVGTGGTGGSFMSPGVGGGNTVWNYGGTQDIIAGGGYGGGGGSGGEAHIGGLGGIGGTVGVGTGYSGGGGGTSYGYMGNGGGGGGSGGPSGLGGQGGNGTISGGGAGGTGYGPGGKGSAGFAGSGFNGSFPGGGGGGGGWDWSNGGQGANGEIIVTYTQAAKSGISANLLINGSFEQGPSTFAGPYPGSTVIPGWVVIRGQIDYYPGWQVADGSVSLDLNGSPGVGGVEQTFVTVPDQQYLVTFSLAGNPHTHQVYTMTVAAAGQSADFSFDNTGYTEVDMGWTTKSWTFTATGTSTTLQMYSTTTATPLDGPALDNVSVQAVPEPSALALLGVSLVGLLVYARRQRRSK